MQQYPRPEKIKELVHLTVSMGQHTGQACLKRALMLLCNTIMDYDKLRAMEILMMYLSMLIEQATPDCPLTLTTEEKRIIIRTVVSQKNPRSCLTDQAFHTNKANSIIQRHSIAAEHILSWCPLSNANDENDENDVFDPLFELRFYYQDCRTWLLSNGIAELPVQPDPLPPPPESQQRPWGIIGGSIGAGMLCGSSLLLFNVITHLLNPMGGWIYVASIIVTCLVSIVVGMISIKIGKTRHPILEIQDQYRLNSDHIATPTHTQHPTASIQNIQNIYPSRIQNEL